MPHTTDDQDDEGEVLGPEARLTARLFGPLSEKKVCCLGLPQAEADGLQDDGDLE